MFDTNLTQEIYEKLTNKYLVVIFAAIVLYNVYRTSRVIYLKRKLGAGDSPYIPGGGFLFSRSWIEILRLRRQGFMLSFVYDLFASYGENWRILIGGSTLFVTSDPDNIKAILATQFNDFALGFRNSHFKPLLGDGIFTLDGTGWKHSRAMLRPNFSREKVAHVQNLEIHLQNLAKQIAAHKGEAFDIQEYFFRLTVDTATEFLFGESLYGLADERIGVISEEDWEGKDKFYDAFNISQGYLATRAWSQNLYFLFNTFEFRKCNRLVHKFADHYVNKALQFTPEELDANSKDGYVFLYELVKETRNPQVLRDQLLNIMIAGRDTTAGLLSFTMFELARNQDVWEKLKAEVYEHFGGPGEARVEDITFESLKKSEYLKAVINEVLRLYPNVPINYRVATRDTSLPRGSGPDGSDPVLIEKGRVIGYVIGATHRNPRYYGKDAEVFRPERWFDKSLKPGWAYLPFNGGPRICLGQQFALTEASYIIVRLCQMFPHLVDHDQRGEYPPRLSHQLTLSLVDGVSVSMH